MQWLECVLVLGAGVAISLTAFPSLHSSQHKHAPVCMISLSLLALVAQLYTNSSTHQLRSDTPLPTPELISRSFPNIVLLNTFLDSVYCSQVDIYCRVTCVVH